MGIFDKFKKKVHDDKNDLDLHEKDISDYDDAIKNDPNNPQLWKRKGLALTILGKYREGIECYYKAIDCYDTAIKNDPNDVTAWLDKGCALAELGRFDEAIKCFHKADKLECMSGYNLAYFLRDPRHGKKRIRHKITPLFSDSLNFSSKFADTNPHYLIEFRFSGHAKDEINELKQNIAKNFHLSGKRTIPHVTIVGPLSTDDPKKLLNEVKNVCKNYSIVRLYLDGFGSFERRVIFVKIKPTHELEQLRLELITRLEKFCTLSTYDKESPFSYHATLVMNNIENKFDKIWNYLQTWKIPEMEQHVIRVSVITQRRKILAEYDLLQGKILDRSKSLDKKTFRKTIEKLQKIREPQEIKFRDVSNSEKIFVFSDAHFDHGNIIRYCDRPFENTLQMNRKLLDNWNKTIGENDHVYYLGDMTYGRNRHPIDYWLGKLSGQKFFIRGNHDIDSITRATVVHNGYGIVYKNYKFLLRHDPYRPLGYDGWIIHGDKHNNHLDEYPLINQKNKTVNVSSELVHYTPLNLEKIISLIETGRSFRTLDG